MKFQIIYYISKNHENPVKTYLDSLSIKPQVKVLRILQYIQEFGPVAVYQHTRRITGTLFWEIRILGKDNLRLIYAIVIRNTILLLHGFTKKSGKIPKREIEIAFQRYKEWMKQ